jgi:hypothetical protein
LKDCGNGIAALQILCRKLSGSHWLLFRAERLRADPFDWDQQ